MNEIMEGNKYKRGQSWTNFMGHSLRVMGTIDKWVMLRYKRSAPFIKHENEMEVFLKKVDAKPKLKNGSKYKKVPIIVMLCLITQICLGQISDSFFTKSTVATVQDYLLTATPKQDTVKVLMLVCDTAKYPNNGMLYFRHQDQMLNEGKLTWWQYGYEVRETCGHTISIFPIGTTCPHFTYYSYLDQNKKKLPSSIVVWITKEIK